MTNEDSINQPIISTPANEFFYLKSNALLSLALGLYFLSGMIRVWLSSLIETNQFFAVSFMFFSILILFIILCYWVLALVAAKQLPKSTYLFGTFKDEYFNHINDKGYKWAFNLSILLLSLLIVFDSFSSLFNEVSIADFSKFIMGFSLIGYALPVLFLLRGETEYEQ